MPFEFFPKAFFCAGCKLPTWKTVCVSCRNSILTNSKIIPLPIDEVEGVAPLLYSFERTQSLIRHWKETGSTDLKQLLFRMPENLRRTLMDLHFFAIIPIPQDKKRSYRRGQESSFEVARFFSRQLDIPLISLLTLEQEDTPRLTGRNRFEREFSENPFRISPFCIERMEHAREIHLLLVDDLITSGSTLAKAGETLLCCFPEAKLWAGSLGFRPKLSLDHSSDEAASQLLQSPLRQSSVQ